MRKIRKLCTATEQASHTKKKFTFFYDFLDAPVRGTYSYAIYAQ